MAELTDLWEARRSTLQALFGPLVEYAAIALLLMALLIAIFLAWQDAGLYAVAFNHEDELIEYAQCVLLLLLSIVCMKRGIQYFRKRNFTASVFHLMFGALFLFVAGEEISWGQRLLDIDTPSLIAKTNRQGEMNLHNIQVGSKQVADYIYLVVELALAAYLLVLPYLYKFSGFAKAILEKMAVPIPMLYVPILLILSLLVSEVVIDRWLARHQGDELTEFVVMYCIGLIFLFPRNRLGQV